MSGAPAGILWQVFKKVSSEDYLEKYDGNEKRSINKALRDIDHMLRSHGKCTVIDVGLPEENDEGDEVHREQIKWDKYDETLG